MTVAATSERTTERRMVRAAMRTPMLDPQRERVLAVRWRDHGDEEALHELTSAYMRLVVAMAGKFRRYGLPMTDLVQEGAVGLMIAAGRFDPGREVRFSTYAAWWIKSQLQDFILRNWSIVRTGTTSSQKSLFFNLRRLRARLGDTADGLSAQTRDAVAVKLGVPARDVEAMAARLAASDRSLNAVVGEDGDGAWVDLLAGDHPDPEAETMTRRDGDRRTQVVAEALQTLNPRERLILRRRRLTDDDPPTLEALGRELGVSKERVRQIEAQALLKLRAEVERRVGDPRAAGLIG